MPSGKGSELMGLRNLFAKLFYGRHGPDVLCLVLFLAGLVMSGAAAALDSQLLGWLVYLPWALALLRMFWPANGAARRNGNGWRQLRCWWDGVRNGVKGFFIRLKNGEAAPRKAQPTAGGTAEYHHFLCPGCGQKLRVPRGRGRVLVHCPRCGREFEEYA